MKSQNLSSDTINFPEKMVLLFLFFLFIIIKILFIKYANPLPDEAYYWLWSKKMSLSYFDHPPLHAWIQGMLFSFSNNRYFDIRALPLINLGIVLVILILWQRNTSKQFNYSVFLKITVLFLAFPISSIFFSISFPDHLLITLLFASSYFLFLYFEKNNNRSNGLHYWYLAVILFSLALLTKYNAVLLGIGVLAYILYKKKQIVGPSNGHIVASIFIISIVQAPTFIWNLGNDFASFSFHLSERLDQKKDSLNIFKNAGGFFLGVLLAYSPIFMFNLAHNFLLINYNDTRKLFIEISKFVFFLAIIFCVFLCFVTNILYYWFIPAVILLIPFLMDIIRSKTSQYLHIIYGVLISLILFINVSFYPISGLFGKVDRETAILFGWESITDSVRREKKLHGIQNIVFTDYRLGSLYIFHSSDFDADVIMEYRRTQFDIWRDKEKLFANDTLIFTDPDFPIGQKLLLSFNSIKPVRDIEIFIGNKLVRKYKIFLGTNR